MNILINVILAIDMLVALLMTLVILMQRPKSEGLGAAFGGGVTENILRDPSTKGRAKTLAFRALHQNDECHQHCNQHVDSEQNVDENVHLSGADNIGRSRRL